MGNGEAREWAEVGVTRATKACPTARLWSALLIKNGDSKGGEIYTHTQKVVKLVTLSGTGVSRGRGTPWRVVKGELGWGDLLAWCQ